jgi:biotin transport system substrate-specific component
MHTTIAPTLTQRYFPKINDLIRDILLVVSGSLLVAAFAQIRIPLPFTPVPITGQTLAVLLIGATLGSRRGLASMALYFILGSLGLPVFAGGAHGLAYISGATAGYLLGFLPAAYAVGRMAERGLERNFLTAMLPFLVGQMIIYTFGILWLSIYVGDFSNALTMGFYPFILGDVIKILLAGVMMPSAWKLIK